MNQISSGKNRQQKREKQKNKKSKGSVYSKKHIRLQAELAKKRMNTGNKNKPKNNKGNKNIKKGGGCKLGKYNPEECCLPGIPCNYPCYQKEYENDVGRCVDEDGEHATLKEIMELTRCERGEYNPEECCEKTEYGPACFSPCYDGENCYNTSGKMPLEKIYKRERVGNLMKKITDQRAGAYDKIYNPLTRRWVSTKGNLGKTILQQYLNCV